LVRSPPSRGVSSLSGLFLFYLLCYYDVICFNTALITCAGIHLTVEKPGPIDGIRNTNAHIVPIFIRAMIRATSRVVLHLIQESAGFLGQIIIGLIGATWNQVPYLVIPVMIFEDKSPVAAIKSQPRCYARPGGRLCWPGINRDCLCNSCDCRSDPCDPCPDLGVIYSVHPLPFGFHHLPHDTDGCWCELTGRA
jgi:hypothetical protein